MKKILLMEDDKFLNKAYKDKLIMEGYAVESAYDGIEGLTKVKKFKPDLILLDLIMPVLDGNSVLKKLKDDPKTCEIPVIILSNLSSNDKVSGALESGITTYLVKSDQKISDVVKKIKETIK
jgi:DNA-binding response OmpR family regulator